MATLAQKMQTMTGYCSSCGVVIIDLKEKGAKRFLPNYREHMIALSDDTLMRVGVCDTCKEKLVTGAVVQATADKILANHKTYWKAAGRPTAHYKNLAVTDPNTDKPKFHRDRQFKELERFENNQKVKK